MADEYEQYILPIALDQILNSDEAIKWYGFNWPKDLIGTPKTVDELRNLLSTTILY